jgi:two-component system nitrogen regulation sensor histidine kinase NtrY
MKNMAAWRVLFRIGLLFFTLTCAAWLTVKEWWLYLVLLSPVIIYQLVELIRFQRKAQDELDQFVESVHYRDFSRHFDVAQAPTELQPLRQGFNDINTTFKVISREKETQYHYLQKILELVDTGILSFATDDGEIGWMNESLKNMLGIPYLKTIHSLERRNDGLYHTLLGLQPGGHEVVDITRDHNLSKVLLSATAFQIDKRVFKLIAFQNVSEALDETEAKAWQKLLSVMTHEIMNSVAPISSLADTLKNRIQNTQADPVSRAGAFDDLELGIETIRRRSEGLLKFAETYRNLNKISHPNLVKVYVRDLFENLYQLMQPTLEQKDIEMDIVLKDPDLMLEADTNLIEQVLINLVVNAIEAVKERPQALITLSAARNAQQRVQLKVADNGNGITPELLDKIFIPFFSTRKTGSGIGLSLCKQIMMVHRGNIQVQSVVGEGTVFTLQF